MTNISVVIPIYNSERYLSKCLESIISQSYKNFELVLVDDGSTDNSLSICNEWKNKFSKIKVIAKDNGGVSSARNAGIEAAGGEWITFIDSDDWIDADYLTSLTNSLKEHLTSIDWVTSGITYHYQNKERKIETPNSPGLYLSDNADGLLSIATQKLVTSPVGKLYKTEIIKQFGLSFDCSLSFGEDRDFNVQYLSHCKNCLITSYNGYNYRKDIPSSLSTAIQGNVVVGDLNYWERLYQLFQKRDFLTEDIRSYLINRLYNFVVDGMTKRQLAPSIRKLVESKIDFKFVRANAYLINGNFLYKFLFRHRLLAPLYVLSSVN